MQIDAFTSGVRAGGLINKIDIKILLCFLLSNFDKPVLEELLIEAITERELVNYFELKSGLEQLIELGHIKKSEDEKGKIMLSISESGRRSSQDLSQNIPQTIRDIALKGVVDIVTKTQLCSENKVVIKKVQGGFVVKCSVLSCESPILKTEVFVTNILQAEIIKASFQNDPLKFYRNSIKLLLGDEI